MSRMFLVDNCPMVTWNVYVGCRFGCTYCSARKLAETRLRNSERYKEGFNPHLVSKELRRSFKPGEFIFIAYMGDISFAVHREVEQILARVEAFPDTRFLMMTKDPEFYVADMANVWGMKFPDNLYLGTTIESNFDHGVSKAPAPEARMRAMVELDHINKLVSIEPLMNFHLATMVMWMKEIRPQIIEIGPDNYHKNLPEPVWAGGVPAPLKVKMLLESLRGFCPTVVEKPSLSRLLQT